MIKPSDNSFHLLLICMMFFAFGFVTWVNAVLIPFFKLSFRLNHFESYFVAFAFYISYLFISMPASILLQRIGFKLGMAIGFWIMALGTMLFIPSAHYHHYAIFLSGLLTIGTGLAVVQTAVNPYVTMLGDRARAAQRISIMGISNKTAGILAPILLSSFVFLESDNLQPAAIAALSPAQGDAYLHTLLSHVSVPYACVTFALALLGLIVKYSSLPELGDPPVQATRSGVPTTIWDYPHLILGAIAIFFHVGSQVVAIDTIINYAAGMGVPLAKARFFPSAILFTTICGYFVGIILVPRILSQLTIFRICSLLGLALSVLVVSAESQILVKGYQMSMSIVFLLLLGLANSMIWACIWPLALEDLGDKIKVGSSLLVMGLCGNAIMPLIYGYLADHIGLQAAYVVLLPCYAYLVYYALLGYKLRSRKLYAV